MSYRLYVHCIMRYTKITKESLGTVAIQKNFYLSKITKANSVQSSDQHTRFKKYPENLKLQACPSQSLICCTIS